MIYVVFLRISQQKKRCFFPSGFIQLLRSRLKAAIFTSGVWWSIFGIRSIWSGYKCREGRPHMMKFPVLWGWREWFFWQQEETLKRNVTISISLCVTVLMIWVMDLVNISFLHIWKDEVVRIKIKIREMVTMQKQFDHDHLIWE